MNSRRQFLKNAALAAGSAMMGGAMMRASEGADPFAGMPVTGKDSLVLPKGNGIKITGTFLDEISWDIPHNNWGEKEWDTDFRYMKKMGIDTVIMIRCGLNKYITYPSKYLTGKGAYMPSVDLVDMFLRLADKHGMKFYFGTYVGWGWIDMPEANRFVIDEVWQRYGHHKSFAGWYIADEINGKDKSKIKETYDVGKQCKDVCGGKLPVFISPYVEGRASITTGSQSVSKEDEAMALEHERNWNEVFDGIHTVVDACAFQDGTLPPEMLDAYFEINRNLGRKYGMECWTNVESFDRDMPIHFLPVKWEKMRMKLEAAKRAGYDKAITFEFSHFMSPQSAYRAAGNLYNRYMEYFDV